MLCPHFFGGADMNRDYSKLMSPLSERSNESSVAESVAETPPIITVSHPSEHLVVRAHRQMIDALTKQLLGYIYVQSHGFFESLIIDVMLALGYGGRRRDLARRLGRSGDGGVDGVIAMDELGLELIFLQAKRLKPGSTVPVAAVRDFVGSLDARHATKGIFVTTGHFTPAADALVGAVSKRIVLVDGAKLAELMVRHNIGVIPAETIQFKQLDISYFAKLPSARQTNSASDQPRK